MWALSQQIFSVGVAGHRKFFHIFRLRQIGPFPDRHGLYLCLDRWSAQALKPPPAVSPSFLLLVKPPLGAKNDTFVYEIADN